MKNNIKIAIIGLGYVGFPLLEAFAKYFNVIGYDISKERIKDLNNLYKNKKFIFDHQTKILEGCNVFIITVPTPVNKKKMPDLKNLKNASRTVAKFLKKNDIVIYESTVFPGATKEICVPILESASKLTFNKDFFCGYSPERINPGDPSHELTNIKKIVSASNKYSLNIISKLYKKIIKKGIVRASSIETAEAAKVIENTQRDVNIALFNEFSIIFDKLKLKSSEIFDLAATKWNFIKYKPGLVGGHCIPVDPYYLAYKSKKVGYIPKVILSGRETNEKMSLILYKKIIRLCNKKKINLKNLNILIMGLSFKENCSDIRNSKVLDFIKILSNAHLDGKIDIFDPWVKSKNLDFEKNIKFILKPYKKKYNLIIIAVPHKDFEKMGVNKIKSLAKKESLIFDVKNLFPNSFEGPL